MQVIIEDHFLVEVVQGAHGKLPFPSEVAVGFRKRINQIQNAKDTQDLRALKSLHFEKLREKKYEGKYSIRINKSYRIIFRIDKDILRIETVVVEEVTNHYSG